MEIQIKVTGMNLTDRPKPNRAGDTVVANLDFTADFLTIKGGALVWLGSGSWTCWEPLGAPQDVTRRPVRMSREARKAVAAAALPLFEALGGNLEPEVAV